METIAAIVMFAIVLVIVGVALDAARRAKKRLLPPRPTRTRVTYRANSNASGRAPVGMNVRRVGRNQLMRSMMTRSLALTVAFCILPLIGYAATLTTIPEDYVLDAKDKSVIIGRFLDRGFKP